MHFQERANHVLAALRAIEHVAADSVASDCCSNTPQVDRMAMYDRRVSQMVQLFCADQTADALLQAGVDIS